MSKRDQIIEEATALFAIRDQLEVGLRHVDARLRELRAGYMHEARVWGLSMERFRQETASSKVAA